MYQSHRRHRNAPRDFSGDIVGIGRDASDPLSLRLLLSELVAAAGEDLVEVVLAPADLGAEAGELPDAADLAVPVGVGAVGVALDGDLGARPVRVALVRHPQLVVADDLGVRDPLVRRAPDEVLRHQERVAEHRVARDHRDELLGRHGLPQLVQERTVVNLFVSSKGVSYVSPRRTFLKRWAMDVMGSRTLRVGAMHFRSLSQFLLS